ncbi:MAG: glycosyltransferase family 39 protein [Chlorobi bacterium]|nr:glycosyltransferase family 39 protein [Chlorobiota bacterium]MCI0716504.1 glycosyltransferase family 39 protein [Chlorobiota bacterium]
MKNFIRQIGNFFTKRFSIILSLILFKLIFQFVVIQSGLKWLTADDYSRTVISWDWLQNPRIYSGVWLSLHFWINGIFMWIFKDLTLAPVFVNTLFSVLTLVFLYLIFEKTFTKQIAVISCLVYSVFPFQVWLSASGMPESIFFFFIILCFYSLLRWHEELQNKNKSLLFLAISIISLNTANLLRYEGWFFTGAFLILVWLLSYRRNGFSKTTYINFALSITSTVTIICWLYLNSANYGDAFYFIKETTKIYSGLSSAGIFQRIVQYPFFIFYIAPLTTALGLRKIYLTIRNKHNGFGGSFSLLRVFLLFNLIELMLLMLSGIFGSGGTNMISRYVVLNSILFFPFAVWQLFDFRKYILTGGVTLLLLVNVIWSFYYQQAYREDTYEVAELTKRLIERNYFEPGDEIYFEMAQGYYDIYPLQVISNNPRMFNSDTIPTYFSVNPPASKKTSKKKREEEQLKLNILELRKFIEQKKIKLFIVRSDLMTDKLRKLSYKSEQIGDYHLFYIAENKIKYKRGNQADSTGKSIDMSNNGRKFDSDEISFDKKLILKEFRIDNSNFGMNPQTVSLKWEIADISFLDSLETEEDEFGRFKVKLELSSIGNDSVAYDTYANVFSERNVEEFFETEEIKNIMILKPFALLNYSIKFKSSPFESGLYNLNLSIYDTQKNGELPIYKGDSLFVYTPEFKIENDTVKIDSTAVIKKIREHRLKFVQNPYYPLGRIIALFPNVNYNALMKKSSDLSQVIIRNGFMLPFLNRYQGDHMLDVVFTYF